MSEEKEKELKDLEKEPKRSRNKTENTRNINFKFQNNTNGTHGEIRYFKKTGSKIDERIAGRKSARQRGNKQEWKMDCKNK